MLITVMSERELHVPRLGPDRRRPRLPPRRGDEPVRRRRHGAHLQRRLRPRVPAQRRLPDRPTRRRPSSSAPSTASTPRGSAKIVELVRRTRTHPDLRVGSSVRGALDATAVVSSLAALREQPVTTPSVGLDAVARRPVRPGAPARGVGRARPRRSSPSCGTRCSALGRPRRPTRRRPTTGKAEPRRGRSRA